MGLFTGAQQKRMHRTFVRHFNDTIAVKRVGGVPLALSDAAQAFTVARSQATKNERLTPDTEGPFIAAAVDHALRVTPFDRDQLVEAIDINLFMKHPKDSEHARQMRTRLAELDAAAGTI
ncbi:hypothetical protein [Nocardioides sp. HB32]